MASTHKVYEGRSKTSFEEAAQDAIKKYAKPRNQKLGTLRVVDMYVTVKNPIHDYRVVLEPTG